MGDRDREKEEIPVETIEDILEDILEKIGDILKGVPEWLSISPIPCIECFNTRGGTARVVPNSKGKRLWLYAKGSTIVRRYKCDTCYKWWQMYYNRSTGMYTHTINRPEWRDEE